MAKLESPIRMTNDGKAPRRPEVGGTGRLPALRRGGSGLAALAAGLLASCSGWAHREGLSFDQTATIPGTYSNAHFRNNLDARVWASRPLLWDVLGGRDSRATDSVRLSLQDRSYLRASLVRNGSEVSTRGIPIQHRFRHVKLSDNHSLKTNDSPLVMLLHDKCRLGAAPDHLSVDVESSGTLFFGPLPVYGAGEFPTYNYARQGKEPREH
jgi:hypothetical protein